MKKQLELTEGEVQVIKAIIQASDKSTGGDFTYFDEVEAELKGIFSSSQVKGYLSSIQAKELIHISDDKYRQICGTGWQNLRSLSEYLPEEKIQEEVQEEVQVDSRLQNIDKVMEIIDSIIDNASSELDQARIKFQNKLSFDNDTISFTKLFSHGYSVLYHEAVLEIWNEFKRGIETRIMYIERGYQPEVCFLLYIENFKHEIEKSMKYIQDDFNYISGGNISQFDMPRMVKKFHYNALDNTLNGRVYFWEDKNSIEVIYNLFSEGRK
ncbi:hypothetical protein UFOVP386_40 [uncultured Caudovirales phage]|uniref:Uncharacterized protein n=1 Tax=uncultured Caudovirales phage TaxID=2100421 RepID=A0A6J7X174_9CAUD|nr:hypothetical protein UFOVP386_40 [uncultured Caudovirales phage]